MATIRIDGQEYEVEAGQNLLQACLGLGLDLPYFCWHPALGSVGACRQCALIQYQDDNDQRGRLVMGCMTPVADGQLLSIKADNAIDFRAGVIESLMTNHPHDCPVCEEGGECHLQDMTIMSGHHRRRYQGLKRTFTNQRLGPFINHEMNRCITCYRCLRYYRDYAGGSDLHAMASRNRTYFGRFEEGVLESAFAGNLVEVCPTGVFTDKTLSEDYSRKWDLQCAPSVCVHCSLGCNISPGERYGRIKRVQNRYHHQINGYFLCDRGRFGYGHVNHPQRPRQPLLRQGDQQQTLDLASARSQLQQLLDDSDVTWIGIGSPRATLEANRALQRLVGDAKFYSGRSEGDEALNQQLRALMGSPNVEVPSLRQVEQADAVLILGEDISHSAPRLALAVRQAVLSRGRDRAGEIGIPPWQAQAVQIAGQDARHPLYLSHSGATELDGIAEPPYRASATEQARLGFAVAHALNPESPAVDRLEPEQQTLAETVAASLRAARQPLLICGPSSGSMALLDAAGQILEALAKARANDAARPWLAPVFSECNSLGLSLLQPNAIEQSLDTAFALAGGGKMAAIVVENDLYQRAPKENVDTFFDQLSHCVVIDCLDSATSARADLLLPATSFAETQGTLINNEGRAQPIYPVYPLEGPVLPSWQWLTPANETLSVNQLLNECAQQEPALADLDGLHRPDAGAVKLARMPHRYSGRTAMAAQVSVHEPKQPEDHASALAFTMEGLPSGALGQQQASPLMPYSWAPGWNSNQSIHKFQQEVDGPLRGGDSSIKLHWQQPWTASATVPAKPAPLPTGPLWPEPQPRVFGGEELSKAAAAITERAGPARLVIHPEDAAAQQIAVGDRIEVTHRDGRLELPAALDASLGRGLVQLPLPAATFRGPVELRRLGPDPLIASDREADHG